MNPTHIGNRRELFWDNAIINTSLTTAKLKQHSPLIREIVLTHDAPWEGDGCNSHSIFKDGDIYRMYYLGWKMLSEDGTRHTTGGSVLCYAESRDGLHWEKPSLGICEYEGSRDNNIIMDSDRKSDMVYVFKDDNPACPPEERYKAIGMKRAPEKDGERKPGLFCFVSADGIHFKDGWYMSWEGKFDTHNIAFWFPERRQYLAYIRDFHDVPEENFKKNWNLGVRDVRVMFSDDFKHWSTPKLLDFGTSDDYPLYTNAVMRYPRAPHILMGMPSRYVERKEWTANFDQLAGAEKRRARSKVHPRYGLTVTDCVFMTSRDGELWDRGDEAIIRPGIERETNWVYGDCFPAPALIETPSDLAYAPNEYSLYVFENHWLGIPAVLRRYTIRQDGFRSYHAPYGEHRVVTRPIVFEGREMELNFSTSARGYVYVRLHCGGRTLSSCELFGDSLERIVPFDGDLAEFEGKEVTLEFVLSDADLYSFRFR